jgi:hypothetical protein
VLIQRSPCINVHCHCNATSFILHHELHSYCIHMALTSHSYGTHIAAFTATVFTCTALLPFLLFFLLAFFILSICHRLASMPKALSSTCHPLSTFCYLSLGSRLSPVAAELCQESTDFQVLVQRMSLSPPCGLLLLGQHPLSVLLGQSFLQHLL